MDDEAKKLDDVVDTSRLHDEPEVDHSNDPKPVADSAWSQTPFVPDSSKPAVEEDHKEADSHQAEEHHE